MEKRKKRRDYSRETALTVTGFDTLVRIDTICQKPVSLWRKRRMFCGNRETHCENLAKKAGEMLYEAVKIGKWLLIIKRYKNAQTRE